MTKTQKVTEEVPAKVFLSLIELQNMPTTQKISINLDNQERDQKYQDNSENLGRMEVIILKV